MNFEEHQKKAFDFAADYSKQLITLATAVITFMVTFVQDVFSGPAFWQKVFLLAAWGLYLLSIGFGIWKQMALTGNLAPQAGSPDFNINTTNIKVPAIAQIVAFFLAISLTAIFGCQRIFSDHKDISAKRGGVVVIQEKGSDKQIIIKSDTVLVK